jgi:hypothetical protein
MATSPRPATQAASGQPRRPVPMCAQAPAHALANARRRPPAAPTRHPSAATGLEIGPIWQIAPTPASTEIAPESAAPERNAASEMPRRPAMRPASGRLPRIAPMCAALGAAPVCARRALPNALEILPRPVTSSANGPARRLAVARPRPAYRGLVAPSQLDSSSSPRELSRWVPLAARSDVAQTRVRPR